MERKRGLLEVTREKIRKRDTAFRTEQVSLQWIRRYIAFHDRRHPRDLGGHDVEQFLTHLAVDRKVSVGIQNQALQAILLLFRHHLHEKTIQPAMQKGVKSPLDRGG
jgi:hypothetical protein